MNRNYFTVWAIRDLISWVKDDRIAGLLMA